MFVTEYRGLSVEPSGHACAARCARAVPSTRCTRTPWPASPSARPALDGLEELLVGPTAITFVTGDIAGAAKALRDTARTNPLLVLKGGSLGAKLLSADDIKALADLPSRDELLAR